MLQYCRFYKGESICPFVNTPQSIFWQIEKDWINIPQSSQDVPPPVIVEAIKIYFDAGLACFGIDDDTPISLKAYMFLRIKGTAAPIDSLVVSRFQQIYSLYIN